LRTYYPKYLGKEVYKRVTSIAHSYYGDIKEIKIIEYDKIHSSPSYESGVHSSGISKPVQSIAEQIDKHTRILREHIRAVDCTLSKFPSHEQEFIKQNVLLGIPMIHCNTRDCERTCQAIRHDFLVMLAVELGEVFFEIGADAG